MVTGWRWFFGAMVASMLMGFPVAGVLGGPVALIGKLVLNLLALALLFVVAVQTRRRLRLSAVARPGLEVPAV